jgi:hypothetical protein
MNLFPTLGFNPLERLRQRLGAVLAVAAGSAGCCLCGAFMAFVAAPGQALQAGRVARLPLADAPAVAAAGPGEALLVTGILEGNTPLLAEGPPLVVYAEERWVVTVPGGEDGEGGGEPFGRWQSQAVRVPELSLAVGGEPVRIEATSGARLSGALHETVVPAAAGLEARDPDGQVLADGSRRYRGAADGDRVTVLGEKGVDGGIVPEHIFAGDRAAFAESQRQAASGLWYSGLASIVVSPLVLIGGLIAVLLGRRG